MPSGYNIAFMGFNMRILGLDPGLRNTGFGIIEEISRQEYRYVASGVIKTLASDPLPLRLKTILNGIIEITATYRPQSASVEKVFVNVNPASTLLLGQARGACISACVLQELDVHEYTALQIKQSVVGYGHAEKDQLQKMVCYLLKLSATPQADAADALACALTHAYYAKLAGAFNMDSVKNGRIRNRKLL